MSSFHRIACQTFCCGKHRHPMVGLTEQAECRDQRAPAQHRDTLVELRALRSIYDADQKVYLDC